MEFNNEGSSQPQYLIAIGILSVLLASPMTHADLVHATYTVSADDFQNSGMPPTPPASNSVSGTYTFTFDTSIIQQFGLVPSIVTGLDITDSDGATFDYDETNSGVNTEVLPTGDTVRIVIGGTFGSVAAVFGSSNDFRVTFDVSTVDYSVTGVFENMVFVTTVDAYFEAQSTTAQLISVDVQPDADNDGWLDVDDNCQLAANSSQRDTDSDGFGNACDPDFNQDCIINVADLGILRANFFVNGDLDTDLNGDGQTNVGDLGILKSLFFAAPGPSGTAGTCVP